MGYLLKIIFRKISNTTKVLFYLTKGNNSIKE